MERKFTLKYCSEFIRELIGAGCFLKRHGKKHDIYANPRTGRQAPVARHTELKDSLCVLIRKQLEVK